MFVERVLWIVRTGSPSRDLPVRLRIGQRIPALQPVGIWASGIGCSRRCPLSALRISAHHSSLSAPVGSLPGLGAWSRRPLARRPGPTYGRPAWVVRCASAAQSGRAPPAALSGFPAGRLPSPCAVICAPPACAPVSPPPLFRSLLPPLGCSRSVPSPFPPSFSPMDAISVHRPSITVAVFLR